MKIFKDIISGDEMFSDSYPMKLIDNFMWELKGKYVCRKAGEIVLAGSNPSAEEADEGTEEAVERGCDIVLAHRLVECLAFGTRKDYQAYLKDYMKRLIEKMNPDDVPAFKTGCNAYMGALLKRFSDLQFFTGENMDIDGMCAIMEYRDENGESTPYMMFFKHGLVEEKY